MAAVVAVPIINAGQSNRRIVLAVLPLAPEMKVLLSVWEIRGPTITVVAASCFVDSNWASEWSGVMSGSGSLIVLIDVEAERLVSPG